MLQPFEKFDPVFIARLKKLNRMYIVTQTYHRIAPTDDHPGRVNLLVSSYADPGLAQIHLNAVKTDRWAAVINLSKETHEKKFKEMLSANPVYNIYFTVVRSSLTLENQINMLYREHMKRYIDKYTNWRLNRSVKLRPSIELIFGELFIILKYASQTLRVKLSDIESMH